jgi:hypothetical protein
MRGSICPILGLWLLLTPVVVHGQNIPDPWHCECTLDETMRLLMIPGGPTPPPDGPWAPSPPADFSVKIRNAQGIPVNNAVVEVIVGGQAGSYVAICSNQDLVKTTDVSGDVSFNIAGGGCYKHQPDACVIRANGVTIRTYDAVMSPGYLNWDDNGIEGHWSFIVNPNYLAAFIMAYQHGVGPPSCHDYDNNQITDPRDLAVFIQSYYGGTGYCH